MDSNGSLQTHRKVLGEIIICGTGCCCGRTDKGEPPVPVDWIMEDWKRRKLLVTVDVAISGCLGPCEISNMVCILAPHGSVWLGGLSEHWQYEALMDWASASGKANRLLPLPNTLDPFRFERFRNAESSHRFLTVPAQSGGCSNGHGSEDCCAVEESRTAPAKLLVSEWAGR